MSSNVSLVSANVMRQMGILQGPVVTVGHCWMGIAAVLGFVFIPMHMLTIAATCATVGFSWGAQAWILDLLGFFAASYFAFLCRESSSTSSAAFRKQNQWIAWWAFASLGARIVDILMLFGVVRWSDVYITPSGAVLASNVVSEVLVGFTYTVCAGVGAFFLLFRPQDGEGEDGYTVLTT